MKRLLTAIAIAAAIYGIGLGVGTALWAADRLPTGATHNDCSDFAKILAEEQGIDEEDVAQEDIKALAIECLAGHERETSDVLHDFITWSVWPALICAGIFLVWPAWTKTLLNQEAAEKREGDVKSEHGGH